MTDAERAAVDRLVDAWNAFVALPIEHADDQTEFRHAIHRAQNIVLSRPARRVLNAGEKPPR